MALFLGENRFRNHAMHAFADVDHLRDATITDDRGERISLRLRHGQALLFRQEMDGFAHAILMASFRSSSNP